MIGELTGSPPSIRSVACVTPDGITELCWVTAKVRSNKSNIGSLGWARTRLGRHTGPSKPFPAPGMSPGRMSAGFGPMTRSYMESVTVRPVNSICQSSSNCQRSTRTLPNPPGISTLLIDATPPGGVSKPSAVVRQMTTRPAFLSAAFTPPTSSRPRVMTKRVAGEMSAVPLKFICAP